MAAMYRGLPDSNMPYTGRIFLVTMEFSKYKKKEKGY
jgi:hypothetical protein